MSFRNVRQGSWWGLGEPCDVPRCLLWRGLRWHGHMYSVSCIFFSKCIFHITWLHISGQISYVCLYTYMRSSHVIRKIETFIKEGARHKNHCTQDNDASVPFKVGTLGPHAVLSVSISCPVIFSWISLRVWNLYPFKGDFSFGKSQKLQVTKSGL